MLVVLMSHPAAGTLSVPIDCSGQLLESWVLVQPRESLVTSCRDRMRDCETEKEGGTERKENRKSEMAITR